MTGITVTLEIQTQTGTDPFGQPIYTTTTTDVDDVLVGEPSSNDITNNLEMYGKKVAYTLAIPKGDANNWDDTYVTLPAPFNGKYHTIGFSTIGIEANIPTRWNRKVHLERIGESETEQHGNQGSA